MNSGDVVCGLCGCKIEHAQSVFYFPKLPPGHNLEDLRGVLHTSCLVAQDESRKIGLQLANIVESVARVSMDAPFFSRSGNIVVRYRTAEDKFEIMDCENFCEIVFPRSLLSSVECIEPGQSILLGMQVLSLGESGEIGLISKIDGSQNVLRTLSVPRLRALMLG